MFVQLVYVLRCPRDRSELVVVADVTDDRQIVSGRLGCPICREQYPIRDGAAYFEPAESPPAESPDGDHRSAEEEPALRIAALLDLTDARGYAILCGDWGRHAPVIAGLSPTPLVLVNPPDGIDWRLGCSVIYSVHGSPFGASSARALALSGARSESALLEAVAPGGRVLGPASLAVPAGLSVIARDETTWVAERVDRGQLVRMKRAGS